MTNNINNIKSIAKDIGKDFPAAIAMRLKIAKSIVTNNISQADQKQYIRQEMLSFFKTAKISKDEPKEKGFFAHYNKELGAMASIVIHANQDNIILGKDLFHRSKKLNNLLMNPTVKNLELLSEELLIIRGLTKNNIQIHNSQVIKNLKNAYFYSFDKMAIAIDMVRDNEDILNLAKKLVILIEEKQIKSFEQLKNTEIDGEKIDNKLRGKVKKIVVMASNGGWSDNVR